MEQAQENTQVKKEKKHLKWWMILATVIGSIVGLFVLIAIVNLGFNLALRIYIKSFKPVNYGSAQVAPELVDYNGAKYMTFTTDDDFKVMQITDVHLGGGFLSYAKDKKAINCVITMIQNEKPNLVVFTGDNVFPIPYISGTINNYMISKTFLIMCEQTGAYYTTTFGNHDTEAFAYFNRHSLSQLFSQKRWKHCIYESAEGVSGESNSTILVRKTNGEITKTLLLIDSNDYINTSLKATINWLYDTIHEDQITWAKNQMEYIRALPNGSNAKALVFLHIPTSEYHIAFEELKANNFSDTANSKLISGWNDEKDDNLPGGRVWYGGCSRYDNPTEEELASLDMFFETMQPYMEAMFCGHDHVNNAQIEYKGVLLSYSYSVDYLAYTHIDEVGSQRGNTIITIKPDKTYTEVHNNYYNSGYTSEKGIDNADPNGIYYPENELPRQ